MTAQINPEDDYPGWICDPCGQKHGRMPEGHLATWHVDTCGWCGEATSCTEPRDFRYPKWPVGGNRQWLEISHLNTDHPGSFLCSLTLYRTHDGRVIANLTDMAAWEIEGKDTIRERFEMLAAWTSESEIGRAHV